jgi:hypothetical protein
MKFHIRQSATTNMQNKIYLYVILKPINLQISPYFAYFGFHLLGNIYFPPSLAQQPSRGHCLLIIENSLSHSRTPHSVGRPYTSDEPVTETSTSTSKHTTLTRERHPCPRRDSNPQSQEASGHWSRRLTFILA